MENRILAYSPPSWRRFFELETTRYHLRKIDSSLGYEDEIVPSVEQRFSAFFACPLDKLKVVILGVEPVSDRSAATGLSYSTGNKLITTELDLIYERLEKTVEHFKRPEHGDLLHWATQGVLMLNVALTAVHGEKEKHVDLWSPFYRHLITFLSNDKEKLVFMVWGDKLKKMCSVIGKKHTVLSCNYPTGRGSAENNPDHFGNMNHFNETNTILENNGLSKIVWVFPETVCDDTNLMVFDIETTGLSKEKDKIGTIVWFYGGKVKYYYPGKDENEFIIDWCDAKTVVGYNSLNFDEPFVMKTFGVEKHPHHIDLMKVYKSSGITGGLKNICRFFGVSRPDDIGDIDGADCAVICKEVHRGNTKRLDRMLYYNFWDVYETYKLYCLYHGVIPKEYNWDKT